MTPVSKLTGLALAIAAHKPEVEARNSSGSVKRLSAEAPTIEGESKITSEQLQVLIAAAILPLLEKIVVLKREVQEVIDAQRVAHSNGGTATQLMTADMSPGPLYAIGLRRDASARPWYDR